MGRTWTALARLVFAAATLAASGASAAAGSDAVAMFRGGLAHTGVYAGSGPSQVPKVKWTFHEDGKIISSPAVAEGTVYFGHSNGNLYALDAKTGATRWKFETGARIASSPAVSADTVYFGSYDSVFYAVDRATGTLKWKFKTDGERRFAAARLNGFRPDVEVMPDPFDVYLSSPALANGLVYFGSGDGNVYGLDARSGALRWTFKTGDVVHSSPAVANGTVYIGSWDTYLYALDALDGKQRWRFKTGDDPDIHNQVGIQSSPAVVGGIVYFGCRDNNIYALDAASGQKLWSVANDGSWVNSSPAVADGKVYYATADTNSVKTLDARTGAQVGSLAIGKWYFFSSPAVAGRMLYAASWDGRLYGIDRQAQTVQWTFQTEASKQNLARFLKPDGSRRFHPGSSDAFYDDLVTSVNGQFSMGTFLSSPVVADHVLYIGSTDGSLYALE